MSKVEKEPKDPIEKCCKKRGVRNCSQCCRYDECCNGMAKQYEDDMLVEPLLGAMVYSALQDLDEEELPQKKCKTRDQIRRRKEILYNKATARNFFKSKMFKLLHLDYEYLRRAYAKTKIQDERYKATSDERHFAKRVRKKTQC